MAVRDFEYRFRGPLGAPEALGGAPPVYRRSIDRHMIVERDVRVAMRDGVRLNVDVFRPADERPAPPLIAWGPYGKHGHTRYAKSFPGAGVDTSRLSDYTTFEAPDPLFWTAHGYAVITADIRGTWYSEGDATYLSPDEAQDFHDLIEWAGTQPWSNGKVGLSGVSYLTSAQWHVAATHPPHLAAINPWEGWTDFYREVARHGGIPETSFWSYLPSRWGNGVNQIEDMRRLTEEHPFLDAYWRSKIADLEAITVPAYVVASWTDQGLHTRGTLEGFKRIASPDKWLEVHGCKKWAYYYEPHAVARQKAFFDRFLKDQPSEVDDWPKVRLEARRRYYVGDEVTAKAWPVPGTRYTRLYLDAASGRLAPTPPAAAAALRYPAREGGASFDMVFAQATDLIGYMKLRLWMTPEGADDMDVFVALEKLDKDGTVVPFPFFGQFEDGPVALGWLRASHREQDPTASSEHQPVLLHQRELKLADGQPVALDIEIWPSGTRFAAGEGLRLVIQGRDVHTYPKPSVQDLHEDTVNRGDHVILTGGAHESYLLVPVVGGGE